MSASLTVYISILHLRSRIFLNEKPPITPNDTEKVPSKNSVLLTVIFKTEV